jgi:hypothetical protein
MFAALHRCLLVVAGLSGLLMTGCPSAPTAPPAKPAAEKEHSHDHDHAHVHKGPHGGHIAVVGKEQFHVEWTHDDASGKVALYVLDADAKKEIPVAAEKLVLEVKTGDKTDTFELAAVEPMEGKTAKFELADQALVGMIEALSEKVTASIKELEINGEKFAGVKLEEHEHHH